MKFLLLMLVVLAAGCAGRGALPAGTTQADGRHVAGVLLTLGEWLAWGGGALVSAGLIGWAASFLPYVAVVASGFRTILLEAALLGAAAILVGSSFIWVGNNPWVIAVVTVLVVGFMAVRYRRRLIDSLSEDEPVRANATTVRIKHG